METESLSQDLLAGIEGSEPMNIENHQKKILLLLMHNPLMTFNQLWNKEGRSNKFAYHLKVLEKDGVVEKAQGGYQLTTQGKEHVTYLERETGEPTKFPVMAVITVIVDGDNILMLQRAKEPFLGHWGFHGGKLRSTDYIFESAKESIKKETGLECELQLKGLFSSKTFHNKDLSYNHQLFIVKASAPKGELLKETKKGVNRWVNKEEVRKLHILPNIPHLIDIATSQGFRWIEADRFQEDGAFKGIDVKKDRVL